MISYLIGFFSPRRFLLVSLLVLGLFWAGRAWAVVSAMSNERLREAAKLYSRVEELWRAREAGDKSKIASMMAPSPGKKSQSAGMAQFREGGTGPIVSDFMIDAVTINFDENLAEAQVSFTIAIPGAPVRIQQEQTEIWEKVGAQWFYGPLAIQHFGNRSITGVTDVGATDVVDMSATSPVTTAASKNPFAPDVSERFDRFRIATLWAADAIQLIDSGQKEDGIKLLKQAVRIGAPLIWERMVAEGLVGTDAWNQVIPNDKKRLLELVDVLMRVEKPKEAVRLIKRLLATYSTDPQLLEKLGDIYGTMGVTDDRIAAYSKAALSIARSEDVHRILWKLGSTFLEAGKNNEAVSALGNAAAADPMAETLQPVLSLLAHALFLNGDFEHALNVYRVLSSFAAPERSTVIGRIKAAAALGNLEEALAASWPADTSDDDVRKTLLAIWPKLRHYITGRKRSASASYTAGLLAEALGKSRSARKAFEDALHHDSTHVGSIIHLLGNTSAKKKHKNLQTIAETKLGITSELKLVSLANALSRSPAHFRPGSPPPSRAPLLFADGNLSRVALASGLDESNSAHHNEITCLDGATLALDVGRAGAYLLSFEIKPFGLQGRFQTVMVMLLDGKPIRVLPLQLPKKRFGAVLTLSADVHSLQLTYDLFSLKPEPRGQGADLRRFAISHVTLLPVTELRDGSICEGGPTVPVDIVSVSSGVYRGAEGDIFVDGEQVSDQMTGLNVATIDQANGVLTNSINLAPAADRSAEARLEALIESLKRSTIVAVAVSGDAAYRAKRPINESLESLGAENGLALDSSWAQELSKITGVKIEKRDRKTRGMLFPAGFRHSYSLIGARGMKRGQALERTGWEKSVIAVTAENRTAEFLDILSLCKRQLWSQCAQRLSTFFSKGNESFIKRLPLHDEAFRKRVIPLLQSTDPTLFMTLGKRFDMCSMPDLALAAFDKSISVSENPEAYFAKAILLAKMNDYNAAHKAYMLGASISPIPRVMHLEDLLGDTEATSIDTVFVAASNGASCHYLNGVRIVIGSNAWTLSAVNPKTGKILGGGTFSKDDLVTLARSIDRFPKGSVIVLAYSGAEPARINSMLSNAIGNSIRHQGLPQGAYRNLVLLGYKLRRPRGVYATSFNRASLMVTGSSVRQ